MRFKKLTLLAGMALAVVAFAIPASASAGAWQHNGAPLSGHLEQSYEGRLAFNTGVNGQFSCQVTVTITAEGPNNAQIQEFEPTTGTCEGQIAFKGCELIHHTANLPWSVNNSANPVVVTKPEGKVTIHNIYGKGTCAGKQETSHLEFNEVKAQVTGQEPITALHISGQATNGVPASGTLTTTELHEGTLGFSTGI